MVMRLRLPFGNGFPDKTALPYRRALAWIRLLSALGVDLNDARLMVEDCYKDAWTIFQEFQTNKTQPKQKAKNRK